MAYMNELSLEMMVSMVSRLYSAFSLHASIRDLGEKVCLVRESVCLCGGGWTWCVTMLIAGWESDRVGCIRTAGK
jgi:hypothetical protein